MAASAATLTGLLGLVLLAVLITPSTETGGDYSSHSPGVSGLRLGHDLARRLGWQVERRETPFSGAMQSPAQIQVLVQARVGADEAHALLEHARNGGSLLVAGQAGALDDSLPTTRSTFGEPVPQPSSAGCVRIPAWESQLQQFNRVAPVAWRRPAPADTVGFGELAVPLGSTEDGPKVRRRAAVGYSMGAGRIVIISDASFVVNDMMRRCEYEADASFVRMLEYLSNGKRGARVAFDEYHHGYGVHGGSFSAIRMYLGGTGSGRMLVQMTIAGLLLLFAAAPRPLAPRDPTIIARRSPLEHADALAHAYLGVKATRTATARLLEGVRRRVRRDRARGRESDEQLLAHARDISPGAADAVALVTRALDRPIAERDLPAVAAAMSTIESALTSRSTQHTR